MRGRIRAGIEDSQSIPGVDQIRVGALISHRTGIVGDDPSHARRDLRGNPANRLGFGQKAHGGGFIGAAHPVSCRFGLGAHADGALVIARFEPDASTIGIADQRERIVVKRRPAATK